MPRLLTPRSALAHARRAPGRCADADRQHPAYGAATAIGAPRQMTTPGQHLLHRIRHMRLVAVLAALVLLVVEVIRLAAGQPVQPIGVVIGAAAIVLLAVGASYRSIAVYIRTADRRETELTNAARLDGATLAANTLQHHIGNQAGRHRRLWRNAG